MMMRIRIIIAVHISIKEAEHKDVQELDFPFVIAFTAFPFFLRLHKALH